MTDILLDKIEERLMTLLSELETQRKELYATRHENALLKAEKQQQQARLEGLVSLLSMADSISETVEIDAGNASDQETFYGAIP